MKIAFFIVNNRILLSAKFESTPENVTEMVRKIEAMTQYKCPPETLKNLQESAYSDWTLPDCSNLMIADQAYFSNLFKP
jgi:hypothetical protein